MDDRDGRIANLVVDAVLIFRYQDAPHARDIRVPYSEVRLLGDGSSFFKDCFANALRRTDVFARNVIENLVEIAFG
jgi:hypothetical protein